MKKEEKEKKVKSTKNKKTNNLFYKIIIAILFIVIIGLLVIILFNDKINLFNNKTTETRYVTDKKVTITDDGIASSVDKLYDATVIVEVGSSSELTGWGSGFVYKTDNKYGYIFTNHHVVDGAKKIVVVNTKDEEVEAELIGSDEYADVAVLKIPVKNVITVAEIGSSEDLLIGDTIFAIGTPLSLAYRNTVTRGILSGKNRMVEMSSTSQSGFFQQVTDSWYMNLLQIDASINSGNSGGPLANVNGEVIGITNSKLSNSMSSASIENMGFAIPIEDALIVAEQLESDGKVTRPVIGVALADVNAARQNGYDVDKSITYGSLLTAVNEDSVAEKAGLKVGDIIIKIGDYKIEDYKYFKYYLYRYKKGDKVNITYIRGGKEKTATLELK